MSDGAKITWFFITIILGTGILFGGISLITNHINFKEASAEIEQLRTDSQNISANSEDVVGQITQYNQEIKRMQARNDIPIIKMLIPNGWDDVELIKLPASSR